MTAPATHDDRVGRALEALPVPLCIYNAAHRLVFANAAAAAEIGGLRATAPIGASLREVVRAFALRGGLGPGDPEALAERHLGLDRGRPLRRLLRHADGRTHEFRAIPLAEGGFCAVLLDISEQAAAATQDRLARAAALETVLAHLDGGVALYDDERRLVLNNPRYEALIGLPSGTLLPGITQAELLRLLAERGDVEAAHTAQPGSGGTAPLGHQWARPDGTVLRVGSKPVAHAGQLVELTDITARACAEAEARERAALLQTTIDHLRQGIIVYGPDHRVRITNRLSGELAGHRPDAIRPGQRHQDVVRDMIPLGALDPGPEGEAIIARALGTDRSKPSTTVRDARGGRVIEVHSDPLPDGGFIVSHVDITARARAEAEARDRAALLQAMLDNLRHGIALYGPDRRLRHVNALAASLSGLAAEDLVPGQEMAALVDRQRERGVFGAGAAGVAGAEAVKALDRSLRHSGTRRLPDGRLIEAASDPMPGGGFMVTWTDITARADAEEAARRRAALLQGTLDGVRHGIALYGPDRRLVTANRLASPAQGLPQLDQRIGMAFEDLVREQLALGIFGEGPEAERICAEVLALDRSRPHRYQRRLQNGSIMEVRSDPTPDGGFVITHSDVTELVQAQAEASRRAALLQVMQDGMRHGIAYYDSGHRLVAANRLAAAMTGLGDVESMLGQSIDALMRRQVALGEISPEFAAANAGLDRGVPNRVLRERPDGTVLEITSDPTPDGGFVLAYSDVTALTRLDAETRRRADILQVMLDNMRHGICYYGPDRRVIAANALAAELGGHPPGYLAAGRALEETIAEQVNRGVLHGGPGGVAEMALRMDRARPHRYVRPHPDGRVIEVTSDPTPDGGFVVTMSDISALVEAEAEARRRAAMQQVMLDTIRHGILLVDATGGVVAANRVFCQLLGLPQELVAPGSRFTAFVDWLTARGEYGEGEVGAATAAAIRNRDRGASIRTVRTRPDGTVLEAVSDPTPDGGWVLTFTDITAERRAQAELERARDAAETANRAKSRFLAAMSHELRTPLNAVIGFSEALLAMPKGTTEPDYLRAIHDAGRHLLSLIDDILDVTRAETTGFQVAESVVDPAAVLEGAIRVMGATAASAKVALHTALEPCLPLLRADELRLRQVLLNLLSNAVKFTPAEGSVTLSAARDPARGGVTIRIADTGIGMEPADIPRAFEPFTQLDNALARRFQGSGLGLYLSRALAAAQGAELTLDSRPAEGTVALLHFPADRLAPAGAAV
ncbi:MAG: PAS-domain containing protein [Acetobacteraceae bacterium]|nr:PAS-domain containing protein [Acetobacteraceae bacterium]